MTCTGDRGAGDAEANHGPPADPTTDPTLPRLILGSYERLIGVSLVPANVGRGEAVRWLYEAAPFCVLAHDTAADPVFTYANQAAQRCFEYSWAEFLALPSRLSAEAPDRAERQRLFDQVSRRRFASGYRGLRVARSGRRFWIEDGTVWQLIDADGAVQGEAAVFPRWRDAEGDERDDRA